MREPLFSASWYRVRDLGPRLRSDAHVYRHRYRSEIWYVLRNPASQRFHRYTPTAHLLMGLMDGERTLEEIWQHALQELGDEAPTQDELIRLLGQLHGADLLQCDVPPDAAELFERAQRHEKLRLRGRWLSPFAVQIRLFDPERFLERTIAFVRPLFGWVGALGWLAVVLPAVVLAGVHWSELTGNLLDRLFTPQNLVAIWLLFPLIKSLHELGHAYAAKAFGGEVHEMGLMLLVFTPVPYVDASSSWAFRSKYRRALVGAAGMVVELFLAALAFYVWLAAEPGWVRAIAYNALLIGGATTLLFNVNPLLRFDGYYIFSDLLEIPNLRARSNRYVGYLAERHLLRNERAERPRTAPGEASWLVSWAVAAFVYRTLVTVAILLWLLDWNLLVGTALGLVALVGWFGIPAQRLVRYVAGAPSLQQSRGRAAAIAGGGLALVLLLLLLVPFPFRTRSEGVVWIPDEAFVRVGAEGFVERLVAEPGTSVAPGDLLLELRDPVLETEVEVLAGRVRELEARQTAERTEDRVAAQVTEEELVYARQALARARERRGSLAIRAGASGRFVAPRAADLPGRFVKKGQVLAHVLDLQAIRVHAVVPQSDIDLLLHDTRGAEVRLAERLSDTYPAALRRIVPGAREELPSPALGSAGGGEVPVDPTDSRGDRAVVSMFEAELELPAESNVRNAGGRVYVRFDHGFEPLAAQWYRRLRQLFLSRFEV